MESSAFAVDDVSVEQAGDDRANGRFAELASCRLGVFTCLGHDIREALELLDVDDVEQVGTRVVEVRAEIVLDFVAHAFHGLVEDCLNQWHAATTACASFGTCLHVSDRLASAVLYAVNDIAFCHIMA